MNIETAFFCDDFRKEDNGKTIFIGCYASDILLGEVPAANHPLALQLALVLCGYLKESEEIEIEISLNDKKLIRGKLTAKTTQDAFGFFPVRLQPVIFTETGPLTLKLRQPSGKWKVVRKIEVKPPIAPAATSS